MPLLLFYDYLTTHVVPGPRSITYFVPVLLLICALLIPPTTLTHQQLAVVFLPPIFLCQLHAWSKMGGIDVISVDITLWSFAFLVYYDPRNTFKRIRVGPQLQGVTEKGGLISNQTWEQAYPSEFFQRIPWICNLLLSIRFTDWKIGDSSHDRTQPSKRMTRGAFFNHALFTVLQSYLILDIACLYVQTDPYFFHQINVDEPFPQQRLTAFSAASYLNALPPRLVRSSSLAAQIYGAVTIMFFLPTLPAVILNTLGILPDEWSPQNWPAIFGPFSTITTKGLRGLWGSWWHQMNRQLTSTPARSLNKALGISTSSNLGYACLVVVSFFLSGVIHMGLVPPKPLKTAMSANEIRFYCGAFFWIQIPGFALDIAILRFLDSLAIPRMLNRLLVLLWLVIWLSLSLPILAIAFRELGYWHVYPFPISPVHGLMGRQWLMW